MNIKIYLVINETENIQHKYFFEKEKIKTISFLNLEFGFVSILSLRWKWKMLQTKNNMLLLAAAERLQE